MYCLYRKEPQDSRIPWHPQYQTTATTATHTVRFSKLTMYGSYDIHHARDDPQQLHQIAGFKFIQNRNI